MPANLPVPVTAPGRSDEGRFVQTVALVPAGGVLHVLL
ncbi:hypothetical protein MetexDRAFT_2234 [Methylorubrum extorquens DSM 13060]|jgi:hypothetical protein|uniref:Uncharacterized protein n=1 Tax=Methylorubrum extorquens DSM 13060 TaxID=882800 RepID=H1KHX2_METEX|nr:hypothetical protein MetexDRAFT_2234 [Methylorubrum extorquens DSM 13060]MCP1538489.1 hypothetical protein [Methylorubrum extorquens]MDF9863564.1 hypothetical protein [Methylorubrum pseudosasae]MDH6637166.1 hypothetical protein [Methylobacterium sp. SuP10 SLI 274]MDH6666343.1 hypothetical protein [Methylorubrum zatmanii]BDL41461.1 hypothetical protein MSPGM_40510 [Methylorubrum sp. GM97]